MNNDSLGKTLVVALSIIFLCAVLVSSTVLLLRPIQTAAKAPAQYQTILMTAKLVTTEEVDKESIARFQQVETQILDLVNNQLVTNISEHRYDYHQFINDASATSAIGKNEDIAMLGRRPNHMPVYWIHSSASRAKIVLPIFGKGMWTMIHGYIALEEDLNTIVGIEFYELGETPGIGDRILERSWLNSWVGKQIYNAQGQPALVINSNAKTADQLDPIFQIDGITGATITVNSVAHLIMYWFGNDGYGPFLSKHRAAD